LRLQSKVFYIKSFLKIFMPGFSEHSRELDDQRKFADLKGSPFYQDAVYDDFSKHEYERRRRLVHEFMQREKFDCLIIGGGPYHWSAGYGVGWLTGHTREWHSMAVYLVLPLDGEPTLVYSMGGSHLEAVRRRVRVAISDVRSSKRGHFGEVIVGRIKELGLENGRIGITDCDPKFHDFPPVNQYEAIRQGLPNATFEFVRGLFHQLWSVKSDEEIHVMEIAGQLCDKTVEVMANRAKPGVKEYELRAAVANAIMGEGADFNFIIIGSTPMSNPKMFFGNPHPSGRILQQGDLILNEIAVEYNGLQVQIGNPICLGRPTSMIEQFFKEIVTPGYQTIVETLKAGNTLEDVRKAASFYRQKGYQSRPIILHGLGVSSEGPEVNVHNVDAETYEFEMKPNMTLMLEPNPISPDGAFGIFMGRSYVITESGHRALTKYPLELTVV
jgi:Xaa-Pro aminopeptidase